MLTSADCPKRMHYGPCGGVRPDLSCEMAPAMPCPFALPSSQAVAWTGPLPPPAGPLPLLDMAARRPVVLTDLSVRPYDVASVTAVAAAMSGACDGLLVPEHQSRPDFPPALMTRLIADAGGSPWVTLTCRDRNRVVLEQELAGLAFAGAAGVLCVTGDGRARDVRPEVTQVFDIDSTQLAGLAAAQGLAVAVAEAPAAPPQHLRAARLREKQRAGARLCLLNHAGSSAGVARFVAEARAAGVTIPLIAGVALYTDARSVQGLNLPGLQLDPAAVAAVLGAADPVAAGIAAAVAEARALLSIEGVIGVNLSGGAGDRGPVSAARIKAEVGRAILAGVHS